MQRFHTSCYYRYRGSANTIENCKSKFMTDSSGNILLGQYVQYIAVPWGGFAMLPQGKAEFENGVIKLRYYYLVGIDDVLYVRYTDQKE